MGVARLVCSPTSVSSAFTARTLRGGSVDIYWSGDRKWFGGVVAKFYPNPGGPWCHRIQYDDGSDKRHTLHFSLTRWRLSTGTEPTWVQCGLCSKSAASAERGATR